MKTILSTLLLFALLAGCSMPKMSENDLGVNDPWVIRTFADRPELWASLKDRITAPVGSFGFRANVRFVDDSKYYGLNGIQLVHALPADYSNGFVFVADGDNSVNEDVITLVYFHPDSTNPADYERPPSAVPVSDLQSVRHLPQVVQEIENNLSIANIDMSDILNGVAGDGVYRGVDH